jgi:hypothetical protein
VSIRDSARVNQKRFSKVNHYARIPRDVLIDREIGSDAKLVYAVLAMSVFQGSVAWVGQRYIGETLGLSQATVCRRLKELEGAGHIRRKTGGVGKRALWELMSPVFSQKQGQERVIVSAPSGARRMVSVDLDRERVG